VCVGPTASHLHKTRARSSCHRASLAKELQTETETVMVEIMARQNPQPTPNPLSRSHLKFTYFRLHDWVLCGDKPCPG
jgi:hypothetical protein